MTQPGSEALADRTRTKSLPESVLTLPAHYYFDDCIFEREKKAIFYRTWQLAGHVEQVAAPGHYFTANIADQSAIVIRGKDQALRAFHNVCSHRAHRLLTGSGNIKSIVCPYHAWSYGLDGSFRAARHQHEVAHFEADLFCLKPIRLEVLCNFIFLNLDPAAVGLAEQAPELEGEVRKAIPELNELTHAQRLRYEIAANWKTLVDNYLECYHCPVAHPAFNQTFDISHYKLTNRGLYSIQGKVLNPHATGPDDFIYAGQYSSWWIWPNILIPRFPGHSMMVMYLIPLGPERTLQLVDVYLRSKTPSAEEIEHIRWIERVAGVEDKSLVEGVQEGLHSRGYERGALMIDPNQSAGWSEHGVHHFQNLVKEALMQEGSTGDRAD